MQDAGEMSGRDGAGALARVSGRLLPVAAAKGLKVLDANTRMRAISASTLERADALKAWAATVSFLVSSPSPRILTRLTGPLARPAS